MAIGQASLWLRSAGGAWTNLGRVSKPTSWSSLMPGGFGSATIDMPGRLAYEQIDYLSLVQLRNGTEVIWEGQVEDKFLDAGENGELTTEIQAFGLKRLLEEATVRRIWVKRDLSWTVINRYDGPAGWPKATAAAANWFFYPPTWNAATGRFDETDPTRFGVRFQGAQAAGFGGLMNCNAAWIYTDTLTVSTIVIDHTRVGTNSVGIVYESADGVTWTEMYSGKGALAKTTLSLTPKTTSRFFAVGGQWDTTSNNTAAKIDFENIRLLGATTVEDATGGLYGGTILNDVLDFCPNLVAGVIETGSDFLIEQLDRYQRSTVKSVVDEATAYYYNREWAVWEGGTFDWKTINYDEQHYLVRTSDLTSLHIEGSIDGLDVTTYVLYSGPSGYSSEASATSTDQRNPFVKQGRNRDGVVQVSFPMTPNTAAQLAAKLNQDRGARPAVKASLSLPIEAVIEHAQGRSTPAYTMRAGRNISIRDLPKNDWLVTGRDGATHFHIVSMVIDADKGAVRLELDGQTRRNDALLARLAAVTSKFTS